jgi:hypothetical protein
MALKFNGDSIFNLQRSHTKTLSIAGAFIVVGAGIVLLTVWEPLLGFGTVLATLFCLLVLIRPAWLFIVVYPLFVSIGQIPLSFGSITISLERLLVVLGGFGFLGGIFVTKQIKLKKVPLIVTLGILIWFIFYVISGVMHPAPNGQGVVELFGYAQKVALAYLVYISIDTPKQMKTALQAYLISGIVASLVTLIAYYEYGSLYIIREADYRSGQSIFESIFQGLARAGTGNAMLIWLALFLFRQSESKRGRFVWGALVFWFGVINLFALRRELLLTIPLGLLFLAWRNMLGNRMLTLLISGGLFILITLFVQFSPEWQQRLLIETVDQFPSVQDPRLNLLFKFTPVAFSHSPWFGYGPGNYAATQLLFPNTVPYSSLSRGGNSPHNAWSAALVEAGIFACLGLCLFLYGLGRPLFKRYQQDHNFSKVLWSFAPLLFLQLLFSMMFGRAVGLSVIWFWFGFLLSLEQNFRVNVGHQVLLESSYAFTLRN